MTAAFNVEWMWAVFVFAPICDCVYEMCLYFNRYCFFFAFHQISIVFHLYSYWKKNLFGLNCICNDFVRVCVCFYSYLYQNIHGCIFDCICILGGWFHCMLHHLGWQAPWICIDCEGCILLPRVSQNYICFPQQLMQQAKSFCLLVLSFRSSLDVKIVYLCGGML